MVDDESEQRIFVPPGFLARIMAGTEKTELRSQRAKQISDASYDPKAERLHVTFRDGTTAEMSTRQ
jgi:hypothetical protein